MQKHSRNHTLLSPTTGITTKKSNTNKGLYWTHIREELKEVWPHHPCSYATWNHPLMPQSYSRITLLLHNSSRIWHCHMCRNFSTRHHQHAFNVKYTVDNNIVVWIWRSRWRFPLDVQVCRYLCLHFGLRFHIRAAQLGGRHWKNEMQNNNTCWQSINQSREKRRWYVGIEIESLYVERVIWRLVQLSSSNFRP